MAFNETKVSDIKVYQLPQSVYDNMLAANELNENAFYLTIDDSTNNEENDPENESVSLPEVSTTDNGKFLQVVNGVWTAVAITNAEGVGY